MSSTVSPIPRRDEELAAIADRVVAGLEERGVPQGVWLVEIGQVRDALRSADVLLLRLQDALIRDASGPQRLPGAAGGLGEVA